MQTMLRRFVTAVLFCTVAFLALGPRTQLQCVAWASMFVHKSAEQTAKVAITETFDGQHPCALCLAIDDVDEDDHLDSLRIEAHWAMPVRLTADVSSVADLPSYIANVCWQGCGWDMRPQAPPPRA